MNGLRFALIAGLLLVGSGAFATSMRAEPASPSVARAIPSEEERAISQVWAREDEYLRLSNEGKDYRALFDERFLGWPCSSKLPGNKASITPPEPRPGSTRERQGETIVNGEVTVFYRMHSPRPDGPEVVRDFIHTWVRNGNDWRIVSGMCRVEG